jgi:hypothetical protein
MATLDVSVSSKTAYEWASGYHARIDAEIAYQELERIRSENDGELKPAAVLEAARSGKSPLHPAFDWDDQHAAEQWRMGEASRMILCLRVTQLDDGKESVRAFVYTPTMDHQEGQPETGGYYVTPRALLENEQLYLASLERARRQLKSIRDRYKFLKELRKVFEVIDELPD